MQQIPLTARLHPDLLRELTVLPRFPSWIKGSLLLRKGYGKGVEGGDGKGGEGKGKGRDGQRAPPLWILDTPLYVYVEHEAIS